MEKLKILEDFKKHIDEIKIVSQQDIVSLESLLNDNIITSQINLNQFSTVRTRVNIDKLGFIINENINKQKSLINSITYLELIKTANLANTISNKIIESLNSIKDRLPVDIMIFLKDEKNLKRYDKNGEIYNIIDSSIYFILYNDLLFTEKLAEIINPVNKTVIFDNIIKHIESYASKNNIETNLETMLQNVSDSLINFYNNKWYENILLPEDKNINTIHNTTTISEVIKFIENIQTYVNITNNILELFTYNEERLLLMKQEDILMCYNKAKQYTELMNSIFLDNFTIIGLLSIFTQQEDK